MLLLLVVAMEAGPAGTLPLLVEVGAASRPPTEVEAEPAGTLPLLVETWAVDIRPPPFWAVDALAPPSWAVDVRAPPSWAVDAPTPSPGPCPLSASLSSPFLPWPVEVMGSGPAGTLPLLVAVGTAGLPSLLWVVVGPADTLPLLVGMGAAGTPLTGEDS